MVGTVICCLFSYCHWFCKAPGFVFEQRRLKSTKDEISDRVLDSNRKMAKLKDAADSIRVSVIHKHKISFPSFINTVLYLLILKEFLSTAVLVDKRGKGK